MCHWFTHKLTFVSASGAQQKLTPEIAGFRCCPKAAIPREHRLRPSWKADNLFATVDGCPLDTIDAPVLPFGGSHASPECHVSRSPARAVMRRSASAMA
jgi:hypothetical protein